MDRLIYTAMSGARQIVEQQATVANNLANVGSTGFRAQVDTFRAVPVAGPGLSTRTQVQDDTVTADFSEGPIQATGRSLDVAVQGPGWLAVQGANGQEAYTRNGGLTLSVDGVLQTHSGLPVQGEGGPITLPSNASFSIGKDGTVSALLAGTTPALVTTVGRLKLVNPPAQSMTRGGDGLFRQRNGAVVEADPSVVLVGGALEGSNVNMVEAMVRMISLGRQFDLNMNLLKNADSNATKANQLLSLNG
jgi:flagellar basal-body rod protein FlgF